MSNEAKYQVEITVVERVTFKRIVEMTAAEFARYDIALSDREDAESAMEELREKYSVARPDNWFDSDLEEAEITHMGKTRESPPEAQPTPSQPTKEPTP